VSDAANEAYRVRNLNELVALAGDAELAGLAGAVRAKVDTIYIERRFDRPAAAELSLNRGAWASAALEGAEYPWAEMSSLESARDEPLVAVVRAAMRATTAAVGAVGDWALGAFGVLARIASAAGAGFVPADALGRPRTEPAALAVPRAAPAAARTDADDPLNLGSAPSAAELPAQLDAIAKLWVAPPEIPALIVAGAVHAELALARPFAWGSGLVARAVPRYLFTARALDPAGLLTPEMALWRAGRVNYVRALQKYGSGDTKGWLVWWLNQFENEGVLPNV
jgi:hypothetical protein